MQIENRKGTANNYVVRTRRLNGKQQKRYIGKASDPVVQLFVEDERLAKADELDFRLTPESCTQSERGPSLCVREAFNNWNYNKRRSPPLASSLVTVPAKHVQGQWADLALHFLFCHAANRSDPSIRS